MADQWLGSKNNPRNQKRDVGMHDNTGFTPLNMQSNMMKNNDMWLNGNGANMSPIEKQA